jgi:hypothetical protein
LCLPEVKGEHRSVHVQLVIYEEDWAFCHGQGCCSAEQLFSRDFLWGEIEEVVLVLLV